MPLIPTAKTPAVAAAAGLCAALLLALGLLTPDPVSAAELAQESQADDIPLAPPPPPLDSLPAQPEAAPPADPAEAGPRPLLPVEPDSQPVAQEPSPSDPETSQPAPSEPAPPTVAEPAALPGSGVVGENVPLPPRRPAPPPDFAAGPQPVPQQPVPQQPAPPPLSDEAATFTDEGSQRFGRQLDTARAGFRRVEGDLHWERAPIPPTVKTACTTKIARLGSSLAASFKEQGLWTPPEPLRLTVDCDDGEGRPIGTFVCKAQDFVPVLDLSCRFQPPAR